MGQIIRSWLNHKTRIETTIHFYSTFGQVHMYPGFQYSKSKYQYVIIKRCQNSTRLITYTIEFILIFTFFMIFHHQPVRWLIPSISNYFGSYLGKTSINFRLILHNYFPLLGFRSLVSTDNNPKQGIFSTRDYIIFILKIYFCL